jgi:hypothetical protein
MQTRTVKTVLACLAIAAAAVASCKGGADKDQAAKSAGAPKIVAVEAAFDFGKVKQGQPVEHVFKIRNEGTAELKIEKAHGS